MHKFTEKPSPIRADRDNDRYCAKTFIHAYKAPSVRFEMDGVYRFKPYLSDRVDLCTSRLFAVRQPYIIVMG